jgi:hypothetical protein
MAQQFLAPSCQIAQFDDAALGQKAAGDGSPDRSRRDNPFSLLSSDDVCGDKPA